MPDLCLLYHEPIRWSVSSETRLPEAEIQLPEASATRARRRTPNFRPDRRYGTTVWLSQPERSAHAAAFPLSRGTSLIVILLLSIGLWAAIWGAVELVSAVLG